MDSPHPVALQANSCPLLSLLTQHLAALLSPRGTHTLLYSTPFTFRNTCLVQADFTICTSHAALDQSLPEHTVQKLSKSPQDLLNSYSALLNSLPHWHMAWSQTTWLPGQDLSALQLSHLPPGDSQAAMASDRVCKLPVELGDPMNG